VQFKRDALTKGKLHRVASYFVTHNQSLSSQVFGRRRRFNCARFRSTLLMRRPNCTTRMLLRPSSSVVNCRRRTRICAIFHQFAGSSPIACHRPKFSRGFPAMTQVLRVMEVPPQRSGLLWAPFTQHAKQPWTQLALGIRTFVN
jgi:hypothetical protein